jgi:glycosyltransferase involved in cell wall biosynthesis
MQQQAIRIGVIGPRGVGDIQGGIETYCSSFYKRLSSAKFDVTIFVSRSGRWSGVEHWIRTFRLPTSRLRVLETPVNSVLGVVLSGLLGIRTIHVHGVSACAPLPLARLLGMTTIVRHLGAEYTRTKWNPLGRWALRLCEKLAARYADTIVCLSPHVAAQFTLATGRSDRIFVIPNGVEQPATQLPLTVHTRLAIEPHKYVLSVGRLVPEKNFHLLVDAFLAADLPPDAKLVIAGSLENPGGYALSLIERVKRDPRIILAGAVFGQDLWSLYANCGVFVLPSMHEGMSFALLEAAISGAKIIASDIPANVNVCGAFARIVAVDSAQETGEAIATEWRRQRTPEEIQRQIQLCQSQHDWSFVAAEMETVFGLPRRQREKPIKAFMSLQFRKVK